MSRQSYNAPEVYTPIGPFSHGTEAGPFVFVSGTGGLDETGEVVSPDVGEQARAMMENVEQILSGADLTFDDLVNVTLYLTNMDDYGRVNEIYGEYVSADPPSRTCVEVSRLPVEERVKLEAIAMRQ